MSLINSAYAAEKVENIKDTAPITPTADTKSIELNQTSTTTAIIPEPPQQNILTSILPLLLVFAILYMLVLRPQQKKYKAQAKLLRELKKGDKVITIGGVIGTITKVNDEENRAEITIAKDVVITVLKSSITDLAKK